MWCRDVGIRLKSGSMKERKGRTPKRNFQAFYTAPSLHHDKALSNWMPYKRERERERCSPRRCVFVELRTWVFTNRERMRNEQLP